MKKLLLISFGAILGLASCKNDYKCSFTYEQSGEEKVESYNCNGCTKKKIKDLEKEPTSYNGKDYLSTCVKVD